jgi:ABC-type transport system substrate-binding protein
MAKDGFSAEFTLRQGAKFHNGDPVTADDVKFSFECYRGGGARILKDTVKEIQTPAPNRVRFVFKEPWPDFPDLRCVGTRAICAACSWRQVDRRRRPASTTSTVLSMGAE